MSGLTLYTTEGVRNRNQLRADGQAVWLAQLEMAKLFAATKQNISLHLKNIFGDHELDARTTVKEPLTVQTDGDLHPDSVVNHQLTTAADRNNYQVTHYNLDAILAMGDRVHSPRSVQFRRWASTVLLNDGSVVKESLTARTRNVAEATTKESSVVPGRGRYRASHRVNIPRSTPGTCMTTAATDVSR
jgi:hypothetical protein